VIALRSATRPEAVPLELWRRHHELTVGDEVQIALAGRWSDERALDVLHGGGFGVLEGGQGRGAWRATVRRERTLADTVGSGMALLCVGLNPSCYSAEAGVGFARPGNRFWPAALAAGLVDTPRDALTALVDHGIGMTDLVKRATVAAAEVAIEEYRAGLGRVERLAAWLAPDAVCVIGLDGWRKVVDRGAVPGWQARGVGGRPAYLMPNPSGLNAHAQVPDLAAHLRAAAHRVRTPEVRRERRRGRPSGRPTTGRS
jgi:TDG/mug DNA glycosylase family protein